jgi:hypothetical protein
MKKLWITATAALIALTVTVAGIINDDTPEAAKGDALKGLWAQELPGQSVRFYYFHGDGNGLYRYGRIQLSNTHSYDYALDGKTLKLKFRKTGEAAQVRYRVEGDGDKRVLILENDPREALGEHRYRFIPIGQPLAATPRPPSGRMWIDLDKYETGGMAFAMYQLTPADISGRGTGWFHRGDFNNWSTESLTYRMRGDIMELNFELTGETYRTPYKMVPGEKNKLKLLHDPRNWWQRSEFADMGKSFALDELFEASLSF